MLSQETTPAESSRPKLGYSELFGGFFIAGLSGFGGALPFARRVVVERRRWLTDAEFADLFSLCQFLPGPNIVNFTAAFGSRHRGLSGAVTALAGLLAAPVTIAIILGLLYQRYGTLPIAADGLGGLAAAASGLVVGTAIKIARPSLQTADGIVIVIAAFMLFGVLHLPLPLVIALILPVSLILTVRRSR